MKRMMLRTFLSRLLLFGVLWWILTEGRTDAWLIGGFTIALAIAASLVLQPPSTRRFSLAGLAGFILFFIVNSIKGGVQVAALALRPRLDLQPEMLEIPLHLSDEYAQIFLASALSLLPGTLSAGLDGNRLRLHVLDRRMPIEHEVRAAEIHVARLFGKPLS